MWNAVLMALATEISTQNHPSSHRSLPGKVQASERYKDAVVPISPAPRVALRQTFPRRYKLICELFDTPTQIFTIQAPA